MATSATRAAHTAPTTQKGTFMRFLLLPAFVAATAAAAEEEDDDGDVGDDDDDDEVPAEAAAAAAAACREVGFAMTERREKREITFTVRATFNGHKTAKQDEISGPIKEKTGVESLFFKNCVIWG